MNAKQKLHQTKNGQVGCPNQAANGKWASYQGMVHPKQLIFPHIQLLEPKEHKGKQTRLYVL